MPKVYPYCSTDIDEAIAAFERWATTECVFKKRVKEKESRRDWPSCGVYSDVYTEMMFEAFCAGMKASEGQT